MCTNTQCCSAMTQATTRNEIWVEKDQLAFLEASTYHNPSDSMTTQTDRTEFCEHSAFCMGRIIPAHMKGKHKQRMACKVLLFPFILGLLPTS